MKSKVVKDISGILKTIPSGSSVMVGGFGLCGIPENTIRALASLGAKGGGPSSLTVISNNCGTDNAGLGQMLNVGMINRMVSSYVGENKEFEAQYLSGRLSVELCPQGTLAERIRAGGAGIPAFYVRTGVNTLFANGGLPITYGSDGSVVQESKPKRVEVIDGKEYVQERALTSDYSIVKAAVADTAGNLQFNSTANNFNEIMATAGRTVIAEVERVVPVGQLAPNEIDLPGVYVDHVYQGSTWDKAIEKVVTSDGSAPRPNETRLRIASRAALEFTDGMYCNLGIGIPTLAASVSSADIWLQSENGLLGIGPYPSADQVDSDTINAGKETITMRPGASLFNSSQSFAMIRGGHIDLTLLGALQVASNGDLANYMIPGKVVKGPGGAVDLVSSGSRVVVTMEHCSKDGKPKILKQCTLPLTSAACVDMIITELAVFSIDDGTMTLQEIADNTTLEHVREHTEAPFVVSPSLKQIQYSVDINEKQ